MTVYNIAGLSIFSEYELGPDYQNFITDDGEASDSEDRFDFGLSKDAHLSVPSIAEFTVKQEKFITSKYKDGYLYEAVIPDAVIRKGHYTSAELYTDNTYHNASVKPGYGLSQLIRLALESRFISDGKVILHSSCIRTPAGAICMTAPSGTGKSTRAAALCSVMNSPGFSMISGDRPLLDDTSAYGVPWDGKEKLHLNVSAPLHSILRIRRLDEYGPSASEAVRRIDETEAFKLIVSQIFLPMWDTDLAAKSMSNLKELLKNVPVFEAIAGPNEGSMRKLWDLIVKGDF